jgi:ABC-type transport system involved in multi-copper enzyme maturation permease subunit
MLHLHPLTRKELVARMRSRATPTLLTLFLCVCGGIVFMIYLVGASGGQRRVGASNEPGSLLFYFVVVMQLLAATFLTPAFASGVISGERQRGTLDLLRAAAVSARQIVWSKYFVALGFTLLFVSGAFPLLTLALFLGSIEPVDLLITLSVVFATALLFTAIGIYISSITRMRAVSSAVSYALTAGIAVGIPVLVLIGVRLAQGAFGFRGVGPAEAVLRDLVEGVFSLLISLSPLSAIVASRAAFASTGDVWLYRQPIVNASSGLTVPSPYLTLTVVYVLATVILLALAERRLRQFDER